MEQCNLFDENTLDEIDALGKTVENDNLYKHNLINRMAETDTVKDIVKNVKEQTDNRYNKAKNVIDKVWKNDGQRAADNVLPVVCGIASQLAVGLSIDAGMTKANIGMKLANEKQIHSDNIIKNGVDSIETNTLDKQRNRTIGINKTDNETLTTMMVEKILNNKIIPHEGFDTAINNSKLSASDITSMPHIQEKYFDKFGSETITSENLVNVLMDEYGSFQHMTQTITAHKAAKNLNLIPEEAVLNKLDIQYKAASTHMKKGSKAQALLDRDYNQGKEFIQDMYADTLNKPMKGTASTGVRALSSLTNAVVLDNGFVTELFSLGELIDFGGIGAVSNIFTSAKNIEALQHNLGMIVGDNRILTNVTGKDDDGGASTLLNAAKRFERITRTISGEEGMRNHMDKASMNTSMKQVLKGKGKAYDRATKGNTVFNAAQDFASDYNDIPTWLDALKEAPESVRENTQQLLSHMQSNFRMSGNAPGQGFNYLRKDMNPLLFKFWSFALGAQNRYIRETLNREGAPALAGYLAVSMTMSAGVVYADLLAKEKLARLGGNRKEIRRARKRLEAVFIAQKSMAYSGGLGWSFGLMQTVSSGINVLANVDENSVWGRFSSPYGSVSSRGSAGALSSAEAGFKLITSITPRVAKILHGRHAEEEINHLLKDMIPAGKSAGMQALINSMSDS